MTSLTDKQKAALQAVVGDQKTSQSLIWWADARASWPGPRKTLGSLITRGLVNYDHEHGWTATDEGRRVATEMQRPR